MTSPMPFDPGFTATNFAGFSLSVDIVGGDKNLGANWNSLQMGDTTLNAQDAAIGGYQLSRFQLVGQLAYGNVTLSRPWTPNQSGWIPEWFALAQQYGGTTVGISINYLNPSGVLQQATYNFRNAYPVTWTQPQFTTVTGTETPPVITESITFSHSGYFDTDGLAAGIDTAEAVQPCKLVILPGSSGDSTGLGSALAALTSWTNPTTAITGDSLNSITSQAIGMLGPFPSITFWVPPETMTVTKSAQWTVDPSPTASGSGPASWNGTNPTNLSFDFILDGANSDLNFTETTSSTGQTLGNGPAGQSVLPTAERLLSLCEVEALSELAGFGSSPLVILVWGDFISSVSYVTDINLKFTRFNAGGQPIRAEGTIQLQQYPVYDALQNPTSGGEMPRKSALVHEADTLAHIAYRSYRSPNRWRDVAMANDIDDPLRVYPGRKLLIPSPDELPQRTETGVVKASTRSSPESRMRNPLSAKNKSGKRK